MVWFEDRMLVGASVFQSVGWEPFIGHGISLKDHSQYAFNEIVSKGEIHKKSVLHIFKIMDCKINIFLTGNCATKIWKHISRRLVF